jgi:hypothetical protein
MRDALGCGRRARLLGGMVLALCLCDRVAQAQIDSGNINGLVTDETGGALPGVTVTARNLETGQVRTVVSGGDGRYQISALRPGRYSVTAELSGFASVVRPELTITVGSIVDVNMQMKLGTVAETITVAGESPLVESTQTGMSTVVTSAQLESLPSRNRDYLDIALLQPATSENVTSSNGTGVVVGGARSKEGSLLVDGFYNLDVAFIQPRQRHSQDLVQEFQVVTFGGSAEYGRAIGGIINVVTKSGTNEFRGSTYGYVRNEKLNAVDFSQKATSGAKASYDREQWGGTFGGPVARDKSFFIGSFERLEENLPTNTGIRPEDIAAIGLPQTASFMPRGMDSKFVFGKYDHNISPNQRFQVSFGFTRQIETTSWNFSLTTRSRWYQLNPDDYSVTGKWQMNSGDGHKLHEAKVSYIPRRYTVDNMQEDGSPLCNCTLNATWPNPPGAPPRVSISGVASFGSGGLQDKFDTDAVQTVYTSTVYVNQHGFKFGADWLYAPVNYERYDPLLGTYSFPSLQAYLTGQYSQYVQQFGDVRLPRTYNMFSAFAQDSWQVNRRLTMNYGLRYDLDIPVKHWRSGDSFGETDYNNFGPRFGVAYDLTGNGSTFVKMISGVYYDRIWGNDSLNMFIYKNDPLRVQATWTRTTPGAPVFPQTFATRPTPLPAGVVDAMIMPDKANIPTNAQLVGTFEHLLKTNLAVTASAIYTRSWYKQFTLDKNLAWDRSLNAGRGGYTRIEPAYRRITQLQLAAPAEYLGGIVELERRGAKVGFNANLTLARSREVGSINDQHTYETSGFDFDYGPNGDTPTGRIAVSGYYNFTHSVQLSGAFKARSGLSVSAIASGLDLNGDGVLSDRTPTFSPGSFRAPANNSVDVRFTYGVPLGASRRVQMFLEGYNLFNHENVRTVLNDYGPTPGSPKNRWLEPNLWFPPREVQLGARFSF